MMRNQTVETISTIKNLDIKNKRREMKPLLKCNTSHMQAWIREPQQVEPWNILGVAEAIGQCEYTKTYYGKKSATKCRTICSLHRYGS